MLRGYTLPQTPTGRSALAPQPPWHYAGDCLAIEYEASADAIRALLPAPLEFASTRCAAYFIEWQFATDDGEEPLDPITSQYKESIFLVSGRYRGENVSFCPFIWVEQDVSLMRGLIQGWPKQIGSTWITRAYPLSGKAAAQHAPGGTFGASLAVKDRRLADARVTLREPAQSLPRPSFDNAVNVRLFPNLARGMHDRPALCELVRLKSRDVQVGPILKGDAVLDLHDHPRLELSMLRPRSVGSGYRFSFALTVDDLETLADMRAR
ncbi:MAG: acetoacetate decarboxylase [Candidatus Muproteobacteria bacterium RBG_16_60_9]|uniref:Acetoacetate decarboxylase n=1 Tax=Candidatus Muproteobacteria bacterium RBG_16_60_9 TaxID=1817755 RepID=A0A1F6V1B1_9PROT|nr:MAG: acetoacetate decarboxylase [Candidatus Muproteobacteria bacterium RBG_16_60_9]